MRKLKHVKTVTLTVLTLFVLALGACREEEQDRFVIYEPGVYKGQDDDRLNDSVVTSVRNRATMQLGASIGSGALGMVTGDVRPPE